MTEDILLIFKVKEEMIMDIQYAISSLEPLVKLVEILTESFKDQNNEDFKYIDTFMDLDEDFLLNIILIIKMLTGKIYSTTYDNIFASGNTPNQSFQKILV